jgi:hypothetical protein
MPRVIEALEREASRSSPRFMRDHRRRPRVKFRHEARKPPAGEALQGAPRAPRQALGEGIVVLPTAPSAPQRRHPLRLPVGQRLLLPHGFREPEAVLVMVLGAKPRSILFCREKNLEREIWDGYRYGPRTRARCSASTRPIPSASSMRACPT